MNQSKLPTKRAAASTEKGGKNPDEGLCCVCFRKVDIYSIGDCNHPVCHNCSTRMRVLCSSTECAICRKDMASVVFIKSPQSYIDVNLKGMAYERQFSIYFEDEGVMNAYDLLLEHVCNECPKPTKFDKFCQLEKHMIEIHAKYYCHLCVQNLRSFTHERKYYTMSTLKRHRIQGDVDDRSHKGHPLCEFCNERFMDKDGLYLHMRKNHYYCHFCDTQQYFNDYDHLRAHFKKDHFLCEEGECRNERFTSVYRSKLDIKCHWSQVHSHTVSKQEARQGRTIDTEFHVFWRPSNDRGRGARTNGSSRIAGMRSEQDIEDQEQAAAALPPSVSSQKPVNIQNTQDFPSLEGAATTVMAVEPKSQSHHNKSMSQKLAAQNRFSVRTGNLKYTQEDFPLLSSQATNLPTASVQVSVNRKNPAANDTAPNVSILYQQRGQPNVSNKPQIGPISHSGNITLAASGGTRPKISSEDFPSLGEPVRHVEPSWVKPRKTNPNPPKKETKAPKPKDTKPDFGALNDFPSLGGASGDLQQVLNYSGKSKVNVPMKRASAVCQISRSSEEPKNDKKSQPQANGGRPKKKLNLSNIFSDFDEPPEDLSMTRLGDYRSVSDQRTSNISTIRHEDLVRTELSIGNLEPPTFEKGEFPSLGGGPVVYEDINSNWRIKPDKSRKTNGPQKAATKDKTNMKFTTSLGEEFTVCGNKPASVNHEFLLPPNFQDRNKELISTIRLLCQNDQTKFNKFKTVAAQLRNDELTYKAYYSQCKQIMGKDNFLHVFPELIALLPDITTQQGILEAFRKADGNKGSRVQFAICSTCQQVLLPEDFGAHAQTHVLNEAIKK